MSNNFISHNANDFISCKQYTTPCFSCNQAHIYNMQSQKHTCMDFSNSARFWDTFCTKFSSHIWAQNALPSFPLSFLMFLTSFSFITSLFFVFDLCFLPSPIRRSPAERRSHQPFTFFCFLSHQLIKLGINKAYKYLLHLCTSIVRWTSKVSDPISHSRSQISS